MYMCVWGRYRMDSVSTICLMDCIIALTVCNSIKTFDFSILYTTIPHYKLKNRLKELLKHCFIKQNGQRAREKKANSNFTKKFSEADIINMIEFYY